MSARHLENETIESYVTRLRSLVRTCDYNNSDEMIRNHVVMSCISARFRQCLLWGPGLKLKFEKYCQGNESFGRSNNSNKKREIEKF